MTNKQLETIEKALTLAQDALYMVADTAGDVPMWNRGGEGYRAAHAVRAALDIIKKGK